MALLLLAACAGDRAPTAPPPNPAVVRARIVASMPASVPDRAGWAADIYAALSALGIAATESNVCAVLAITAQESSFAVDPKVANLPRIAWAEIDRRADSLGVPQTLVHLALRVRSPTGESYAERIDTAQTEGDLSRVFEDLVAAVPLGERLFSGYNPVRTAGPMQVRIDFAERWLKQADERPYPYPLDGTARQEVFTRRGGLYFGVAHLLAYPANYTAPIYRFADYNAGRYASRNAAFQQAVSTVSGIPLVTDGDLIRFDGDPGKPGSTELALRSIGERLGLGDRAIRSALEQGDGLDFDSSRLAERVWQLAEQLEGKALPRARIPTITLRSPKFTRQLTTEWFARRVQSRYERCLKPV